MAPLILTLNAGSSSLKFSLFDAVDRSAPLARGQVDGLGTHPVLAARRPGGEPIRRELDVASHRSPHDGALADVLAWLDANFPNVRVGAVGHRVVHGGPQFVEPEVIDEGLLDDLRRLVPLAPLHQPHNLAGIDAARFAFPGAVQVACFDTAFHRGHPFVADTFALPRRYYDEGVRRYGFHGLSYEFVARKLREIAPVESAGHVIVAHLGNGASMCAMRDGRSVASTMGFTALDGLPMGTRCGQLDPGVLLYLMQEKGFSPGELSTMLYAQSGLKGLSGISSDMRDLEASQAPEAREAIDYFVFRVRMALGSMAAALSGVDAVVFCGGIGENAAGIRASILAGFDWLGVELDAAANAEGRTLITTPDSRIRAFVVRTDEEAMIADHTVRASGLDRAPHLI